MTRDTAVAVHKFCVEQGILTDTPILSPETKMTPHGLNVFGVLLSITMQRIYDWEGVFTALNELAKLHTEFPPKAPQEEHP